MFLAKVTGSVISTQKVDLMVGQKLFVVEPLRINEQTKDGLSGTGRTFICVDTVGCGEGETVLIVQGSSARFTESTKKLPVDATIIGIVDQVQVGPRTVFKANGA
ncbi:MAG: EutN/CcmL family microcompartment protein [Planctomyces sp.]|nr:EutN/CcmL family microcompartment protein [Planctomyces sp.]